MLQFCEDRPGLLVSVRSAAEAIVALEGGTDVIDVKEPARGSLGRADDSTVAAIVQAVGGRAMVTAALGEWSEVVEWRIHDQAPTFFDRVALVKLGLAGMALRRNWQQEWMRAVKLYRPARPVAVVYADWQVAGAPAPDDVLAVAVECGSPALLVDTWQKSGGALFDLWTNAQLARFVDAVRATDIAIVLAGSLSGKAVTAAARLLPDLVAVRTAACDGGRDGIVSAARVRELKASISQALSKGSPAPMASH
jgi:(5-formylfuran-3-yl)methyl phosphate synthase